jgi:hypothetical protein
MPIPPNALDLEIRGYAQNGEPVLIDAFRLLKKQWASGDRDRELGLHLLFLSWYGLVEPPFVFGEYDDEDALQATFNEVFDYFKQFIDNDPELLFVIGVPAHLFPYILGNEKEWKNRYLEFRKRFRVLRPNGIEPDIFQNRGAFGAYYENMAKVAGEMVD